jgi:hypothetical protein
VDEAISRSEMLLHKIITSREEKEKVQKDQTIADSNLLLYGLISSAFASRALI